MASVRGLLNIQYLNESTHARNAPRSAPPPRSGFRRRLQAGQAQARGGDSRQSERARTGALPLPAGAPAHLASRLFNE